LRHPQLAYREVALKGLAKIKHLDWFADRQSYFINLLLAKNEVIEM